MCTEKSKSRNLLSLKLLFGEPQEASWYVSKALNQIVAFSVNITFWKRRKLNFKFMKKCSSLPAVSFIFIRNLVIDSKIASRRPLEHDSCNSQESMQLKSNVNVEMVFQAAAELGFWAKVEHELT